MIHSRFKEGISLDLDPAVRENIQVLKTIDFELAYLALLTRYGIKPMSRWEKPLDEPGFDAL